MMTDCDWANAELVDKDNGTGEMIVSEFKDCPSYCKWLTEFIVLQPDKTYRTTYRCINLFCDKDGPVLVSGSCAHFSERTQKPPRRQEWIAERLDRIEAKLNAMQQPKAGWGWGRLRAARL